jgi:hypothetical protein
MGRRLTPDQRADRLASRQHGAISLAQALDVGLTVDQIRSRVRTGRWRKGARGTFIVAGAPETWQQAVMVACLAGPPGTVASHLTAAALFGLWKPPPRPHVTVPRQANGRSRVAVLHRACLEPEDKAAIGVIPCTRPARTIVDCAALLGYEALCELVDDALCRPLILPDKLRRAMERASRAPGRKGLANLERALKVWTPGPRPGSQAEMRLVRRLQQWGFPLPERQWVIRDANGKFVAKVDLGWPEPQVGFEYQGERHHSPRDEEHDARRKKRIEALGWEVEFVYKSDLRPGSTRLQRWLAPRLGLRGAA